MFEQLAAVATLGRAIEGLEVPVDGDALAEVVRPRGRLDARIAGAVAAFEASGRWEVEGATSMTAWLRDRGGMPRWLVPRLLTTGRRLAELPGVAQAARDGRLSAGQVQAIVSAVSDDTVGVFAEQEPALVGMLAGLGPADTVTALAHWRARAEARVGADHRKPEAGPGRSLHHSCTIGDRWEGTWSLDAEGGALLDTAIRVASTRDAGGEPARPAPQRRADALVDLCRWFLDHQHDRPGGRHRPHLNLVVEEGPGHDLTGRVVGGPELDRPTLERLACDCALHRVAVAGRSIVLDYGRATRTVPAPLWNALVVRDGHCRFPGCDRPAHWCEAHHLWEWEHGGATRPDNLALLCSRHHHLLHLPGWQAKLLPDATFEVTRPDGTVRGTLPAGQLRLPDPGGWTGRAGPRPGRIGTGRPRDRGGPDRTAGSTVAEPRSGAAKAAPGRVEDGQAGSRSPTGPERPP
jgi:hypothetical protein